MKQGGGITADERGYKAMGAGHEFIMQNHILRQ
jgi:hypothetical protein